jgi:hypothetical protein
MKVLSTKQVGELLGRPGWQVRVIADTLKPEFQKIGRQRAIPEDRVPEIESACEARYGKTQETSAV